MGGSSKKKSRHRSRSRSRNRSRSRSRNRSQSRNRSSSRSRNRSRSRSSSTSRSRRRSRECRRSSSRERRRSKERRRSPSPRKRSPSPPKKRSPSPKKRSKSPEASPPKQIVPSFEDVAKIEDDSFTQESFVSRNPNIPQATQAKKKKRKKKNQQQQQKQQNNNADQKKVEKVAKISHENAIFGSTASTMHIGRFTSRIDTDKKEVLKSVESDDLVFGAMFCEEPEIRMKRWLQKLTEIRKRITAEENE